jgi:hypothetical protein
LQGRVRTAIAAGAWSGNCKTYCPGTGYLHVYRRGSGTGCYWPQFYQDGSPVLLAIENHDDTAIEDGSFVANPALRGACEAAKADGRTLHVMGLLSPGGVHSHETHLFAMLRMARDLGVPRVAVHAFLDGRDTPPRSAQGSLVALQAVCDELGNARIALQVIEPRQRHRSENAKNDDHHNEFDHGETLLCGCVAMHLCRLQSVC